MAGGGGEKVEARTPLEVEAESGKHTELLRSAALLPCDADETTSLQQLIRFALLPCDPEECDPAERTRLEQQLLRFAFLPCDPRDKMAREGENWKPVDDQLLGIGPKSSKKWCETLTFQQRLRGRTILSSLYYIREMTHLESLLEEHLTKKEMEGESRKLMEQLQSEVLSCGPAVQICSGDEGNVMVQDTKKEMEGESRKLMETSHDRWTLERYHRLLYSELEKVENQLLLAEVQYVKQLLSELRRLLEPVKAQIGKEELDIVPVLERLPIFRRYASRFLEKRGYTYLRPISPFGVDAPPQHPPKPRKSLPKPRKSKALPKPKESKALRREEQAKMERASSSSQEQQPKIQDSELKSGPTVEDPLLGFLPDMPFASADDDDAAPPEAIDDIGEPLLLLEEQAKMEGESSNSQEQQTRIQDSELKSGPTVEDPLLGFLLDMPFASADDDDAAPPKGIDDIGEPLLLLEEQAKMEGESSNSQEQQPRIQDSELKSGPAVEDPFLGLLLDIPFASVFSDDDNEQDVINMGKSAEQIANEEKMAREEKEFDSYRRTWEYNWGKRYGCFEDMTAVSPMHFTDLTPGWTDVDTGFEPTLQIFTIKLAEIKGGIDWPLDVYGVIAARDDVDHNRNLLFSCSRMDSQELDQDDPFLCLIGPTRAILFTDHVKFEVQLRVKGTTVSEDRPLISAFCDYTNGYYPGVFTTCFENCFCKIELCLERIERTVQATVLSVRVKNGPWPFRYGGEVACFAPSSNTAPSSMNVMLLASRGIPILNDSDGYINLSRKVVSVDLEGSLTVSVHAYSESGEIAAQGQVCFIPRTSNITQGTCFFADTKVEMEITVAWSPLVSDKRSVARKGWMSK